jgi:hypothetical protein
MYVCPFLTKDGCGIYDVRPLTCRTWFAEPEECLRLVEYKRERDAAVANPVTHKEFVLQSPDASMDVNLFLSICSDDLAAEALAVGSADVEDPLFAPLKDFSNHVVANAIYAGCGFRHLLPDYENVFAELKKKLS